LVLRACVKSPKESRHEIARQVRGEKAARGIFLKPKDTSGITEKADKRGVNLGIAEAERLLTLPVPPEELERILVPDNPA
jgi:hypothetical protein